MKCHLDTHKPRNDRLMKVTGERWVHGGETQHWNLLERIPIGQIPIGKSVISKRSGHENEFLLQWQDSQKPEDVESREALSPSVSTLGWLWVSWDYAQPRTAARVSPAWPTAQLNILVIALWPGCYVFGRDVLDLRSLSMRPKPHIL